MHWKRSVWILSSGVDASESDPLHGSAEIQTLRKRKKEQFVYYFIHASMIISSQRQQSVSHCLLLSLSLGSIQNSTCFNHYTYCKKQMMEHVGLMMVFPLNRNSQYYNDPFYVLMSLRLGFMGWPLITEDKQEQWCFIMLRYYHCMMQCWH